MAEHDATHGEHLGQVAEAQLVAQAPEHHERNDVGGVLRPVQHTAAALIELLATGTAAEPAIALGGALRSLRDRLRPTVNRSGFLGGVLAWITRLGQAPPSDRNSALRLRPAVRFRWA